MKLKTSEIVCSSCALTEAGQVTVGLMSFVGCLPSKREIRPACGPSVVLGGCGLRRS